jgi:hypothetical protein
MTTSLYFCRVLLSVNRRGTNVNRALFMPRGKTPRPKVYHFRLAFAHGSVAQFSVKEKGGVTTVMRGSCGDQILLESLALAQFSTEQTAFADNSSLRPDGVAV